MVQSAVLASFKYGCKVLGATGTDLRQARMMQAPVQAHSLAGKSIRLMLMLADSPRNDPAYSLNLDPLRALATA
eukprot:3168163-Pyramimonas_sp.AAC.1